MYNEKIADFMLYSEVVGSTAGFGFFVSPYEKDSRRIDTAIKTFAPDVGKTEIIGFVDTTVFGSGKTGLLFTEEKLYFFEKIPFIQGRLDVVSYKDISLLKVSQSEGREHLVIEMKNGDVVDIVHAPFVIYFAHIFLTALAKKECSVFVETKYNGEFKLDFQKVEENFWGDAKKKLYKVADFGALLMKKIAEVNSQSSNFTSEEREMFLRIANEFDKIARKK